MYINIHLIVTISLIWLYKINWAIKMCNVATSIAKPNSTFVEHRQYNIVYVLMLN